MSLIKNRRITKWVVTAGVAVSIWILIALYKPYSPFLMLWLPASDKACKELVSVPFSLSNSNSLYSFDVTHDYVGEYGILMRTELVPRLVREGPESNVVMSIRLFEDKKLLREIKVDGIRYHYHDGWSSSDVGGNGPLRGASLGGYSVPDDIPIKTPIRFEIDIEHGDKEYQEVYKPHHLVIRRDCVKAWL